MKKILSTIEKIVHGLIIINFAAIVIFGFIQVISRYFLSHSFIWVDELSKYMFIWLVYLAISEAAKNKAHIKADFLISMFHGKSKKIALIFGQVVSLIFLGICIWITPELMSIAHDTISSTVGIPLSYVYAGMFVGFILTFIFEFMNLIELFTNKSIINESGVNEQSLA